MNQTTFEKGHCNLLRAQLQDRFGELPASVVKRLEQMSVPELIQVGKAILRVQSLRDLGLEGDVSTEKKPR